MQHSNASLIAVSTSPPDSQTCGMPHCYACRCAKGSEDVQRRASPFPTCPSYKHEFNRLPVVLYSLLPSLFFPAEHWIPGLRPRNSFSHHELYSLRLSWNQFVSVPGPGARSIEIIVASRLAVSENAAYRISYLVYGCCSQAQQRECQVQGRLCILTQCTVLSSDRQQCLYRCMLFRVRRGAVVGPGVVAPAPGSPMVAPLPAPQPTSRVGVRKLVGQYDSMREAHELAGATR